MKSDLAIHISECLKEVDKIEIDWRVIKKYADDFEEDICGYCGHREEECICEYDDNGVFRGE